MVRQKLKGRKTQIRTKNFSAKPLKNKIRATKSVIVRLGSLTPLEEAYANRHNLDNIIEINTVNSVKNSRDKLLMKECFNKVEINHAKYWNTIADLYKEEKIPYPIVAKLRIGFKARGMKLLTNEGELKVFEREQYNNRYFFEKFYNYAREYRLHIADNEVFLVWRKLRRNDTEIRWYFNDSNCNWINENHELFNKPNNWNTIKEHCILAIQSTGLKLGAVDVRVQSNKHEKPHFIICEVNSAPSLGEIGIIEYKKQIKNLIIKNGGQVL